MKLDQIIFFRSLKQIFDDPVYYTLSLLYCSVVMFAVGMIIAYFV